MKKLPAKKFHKIYLLGSFGSLLFANIFGFLGAFLIFEIEESSSKLWGIFSFGMMLVFIFCIIGFIIWGRKRYMNLGNELYEEAFDESIKNFQPVSIGWISIDQNGEYNQGEQVILNYAGLELVEIEKKLPWATFKVSTLVRVGTTWYISLGNESYQPENWDGILIYSYPKMIETLEYFWGNKINKETYDQEKVIHNDINNSTIYWRINWVLLLEKVLFVITLLTTGMGIGVYLVLNTTINMNVSIIIINILFIPIIIIGYPLMFNHRWKKCYLINKVGVGYARGRYDYFIPYSSIDEIEVLKRNIKIFYRIINQYGLETIDTFIIPKNKYLIKQLISFQISYDLTFEIKHESN